MFIVVIFGDDENFIWTKNVKQLQWNDKSVNEQIIQKWKCKEQEKTREENTETTE